VFVFREQGIACGKNFEGVNDNVIEMYWYQQYKFQWRVAVAIWSILGGACGLGCIGGILGAICK